MSEKREPTNKKPENCNSWVTFREAEKIFLSAFIPNMKFSNLQNMYKIGTLPFTAKVAARRVWIPLKEILDFIAGLPDPIQPTARALKTEELKPPFWIYYKDAAKILENAGLKVSPRYIPRQYSAGKCPFACHYFSGHLYVIRQDVEAYAKTLDNPIKPNNSTK